MPGPAAETSPIPACPQSEELLKRPHAPEDSQLTVPRDVLAREEIGDVDIPTVKEQFTAARLVSLEPDIHVFAGKLEWSHVEHGFQRQYLIAQSSVDNPGVEPLAGEVKSRLERVLAAL